MDNFIILCAGGGSRAALGYNKIFHTLAGGRSVLDHAIERFEGLGRVILVASLQDMERICGLYPQFSVVEGGATRTQSVRNALAFIAREQSGIGGVAGGDENEVVAIHDAARPFVSLEVIQRAVESARKQGSGIPAVDCVDSVARVKNDKIAENIDKSQLVSVQTPQCFRRTQILDAYARVTGNYGDDSEVYLRAGYSPTVVSGDYANKKLTNPQDFATAAMDCLGADDLNVNGLNVDSGGLSGSTDFSGVARSTKQAIAVGSGFDVHELVEGRPLILGGVKIPHDKGLMGHSDADVLAHALTDCILSAASSPDIGVLFPDTDPAYKNADSMVLLEKAHAILAQKGRRIASISCVVIAQKPRLAPYIPAIRESIANRLKMDIDQINISATTTEFLGIVGEGRAIAAMATALFSDH